MSKVFRTRGVSRLPRISVSGLLSVAGLSVASSLCPVQGWAADQQTTGSRVSSTLGSAPDISTDPELVKLKKNKPGQIPTVHQGPWGVFNAEAGVAAGFGPVARYGQVRWAEDWSYLRDPSLRKDFFDPLKFVKLNDSGSIYVTFNGSERLRNFFDQAPFYGYQSKKSSDRLLLRSQYGADVHLGDHLRIYTDVISGQAWGHNYFGYNGTQRTNMDFLNLFAEVKGKVLGGQGGIIVGRQQFLDVPNYMIFDRSNPNIPQSWEGVRAYNVWSRFRVDVFDFVSVDESRSGAFKFRESWGNRLWGAYGSYALPSFKFLGKSSQIFADLFYMGYLVGGSNASIANAKVGGTTPGTTHRDNVGVRFWGKAGPIEFSLGGIYQGGEFRPKGGGAARPVEAFALNNVIAWRFSKVYGTPSLGIQADYYSGGNYNDKTGTIGTYITPFSPSTSYLDSSTYLAPGNLISVGPNLLWVPLNAVAIRARLPLNWRANTDDAVHGTNRIYPPRGNLQGGFIGFNPQLSVALRINQHLTFTNDFAHMFLSDGMHKAGAKDGFFWLSTLEYRF
ncbi:putative exported protein [Granulibacter bethesdensis]|uniref:Exported protein n=1 Tax=Granulibacter bethesdensis TaxID=364410 RepID=A0AAC9KEQ4_9PROT|nr:putative exported protein [Granulibacter bethesdensis]APH62381.1 putative exported protein [Granulibacter bethesdensis]